MSISFVKSAKKTNIRHNNRDLKENEYNQKAHRHIQRDLSEHNIYIKRENIQDVYEKLFGDAVKEYNSRQTRSDRQIKNYYQYVKKQKNLEVQREFVLTLGDYKNWEQMGFEQKLVGAEALQEAVSEFIKNNPRLYVYNAVVHVDEVGAPHAHINAIPMATGYKQGMLVRPSFDKALENQGISEKGKHKFEKWRNTQVKTFEQVFKDYGVSRKLVGTNAIKDMNEYKEYVAEVEKQKKLAEDFEEKISNAEQEYENINSEINVLRGQFEPLREKMDNLSAEYSKTSQNVLKEQNKLNDIKEEIQNLEKNHSIALNRNRVLALQNADLSKENQRLLEEIQANKQQLSEQDKVDFSAEVNRIANETITQAVNKAVEEFKQSEEYQQLLTTNKQLDLAFAENITGLPVHKLALEYLQLKQFKDNIVNFVQDKFEQVKNVMGKLVGYKIDVEQHQALIGFRNEKVKITPQQDEYIRKWSIEKQNQSKQSGFYAHLEQVKQKQSQMLKEKTTQRSFTEEFFKGRSR